MTTIENKENMMGLDIESSEDFKKAIKKEIKKMEYQLEHAMIKETNLDFFVNSILKKKHIKGVHPSIVKRALITHIKKSYSDTLRVNYKEFPPDCVEENTLIVRYLPAIGAKVEFTSLYENILITGHIVKHLENSSIISFEGKHGEEKTVINYRKYKVLSE